MVMWYTPIRLVRLISWAVEVSMSPSFTALMWLMEVSTETAWTPCAFAAKAKQLSPSAYVIPPWAIAKPFSITSFTVMRNTQDPGSTEMRSMPNQRLYGSWSYMRSTTRCAKVWDPIAGKSTVHRASCLLERTINGAKFCIGYLRPNTPQRMTCFTTDFNAFFMDLAKNNNKEWFDANRKRYESSVKKPFHAFVGEAIQRIGKLDRTVAIEPKEAIFRINRDIRFSKDKTPYKLSCSAIISPAGRKDHAVPGLYLELGPEHVGIYGGAYMPDKVQLECIRTAIVQDGRAFRKIIGATDFVSHFGSVRGEANKILPKEFKAAVVKEPLIANKQFYVMAERPAKLVASATLMNVIMDHYKAVRPFNDWLKKAMHGG